MYIYFLFILVSSIVFISTVIMTFWFKTNRVLNFYIIATSITLCVYLMLYGINNIVFYYNKDYFNLLHLKYSQVILILTPSVYLFFEKIVTGIKFCQKKDIYFFIIPLLCFGYLGELNYYSSSYIKILSLFLFLLYTLFYVFRSYDILKTNVPILKINSSNSEAIVTNWIYFIFKMLIITLFHFYISEIYYLYFDSNNNGNLAIEFGFLIIFLIGYFKVITTPELLYGSSRIDKITNYNLASKLCISKVWKFEIVDERLNDKDQLMLLKIRDKVTDYIRLVESIAIDGCSFIESDYTIYDLSKQIGLPKYYLDFIFKYYCNLTFNEYKKLVRIYIAIELINQGFLNSNKLDALAKHVGFASYNPFLINFKEITGVSPKDYNKNKIILKQEYL